MSDSTDSTPPTSQLTDSVAEPVSPTQARPSTAAWYGTESSDSEVDETKAGVEGLKPDPDAANDQPRVNLAIEEPVVLQVGERRFTTTKSTLMDGSTYFASFFSGRWTEKKSDEGSFFIDADGDSFEHILRYLRCRNMPLFWTQSEGFDHQKYTNLEATADFFGVLKLKDWIAKKKYESALTIETTTALFTSKDGRNHDINLSSTACGAITREYQSTWRLAKEYVCPRGIILHMGFQNRCGSLCTKARGSAPVQFVEFDAFSTLVIQRRIVFNPDA